MSAGPGRQRVDVMGREVLAVLVQVGAVGVERVAREAALQLQVGEEVEDEPLEAGLGADRGRCGDWHGGGVLPAAPSTLAAQGGARGEGGGEEERVLLEAAAHRPRRQAGSPRSRRGRPGASRRWWRQPAAVARIAIGTGSSVGTGISTAPRSSSQDRQGVVADRPVALARVGAERRGESRVGRPRASEAWAVSRAAMPPWPRRVSEPMIPGPGPGDHRVPAEPVGGGVEGAGDRDRLVLAAVGRRGGDVAAEQAALAQLGDVAAERTRQRPSPGLHVADLQRPAMPAPRPRPPAPGARAAARPRPASRIRRFGAPFPAISGERRTGSSTGSTGCWIEV